MPEYGNDDWEDKKQNRREKKIEKNLNESGEKTKRKWEPRDEINDTMNIDDQWEPFNDDRIKTENKIKQEIPKIEKDLSQQGRWIVFDEEDEAPKYNIDDDQPKKEQLSESDIKKIMEGLKNPEIGKTPEDNKPEMMDICDDTDKFPIPSESNNNEHLIKYIIWFLKNEDQAFIDPPPGTYKLIKQVKAKLKKLNLENQINKDISKKDLLITSDRLNKEALDLKSENTGKNPELVSNIRETKFESNKKHISLKLNNKDFKKEEINNKNSSILDGKKTNIQINSIKINTKRTEIKDNKKERLKKKEDSNYPTLNFIDDLSRELNIARKEISRIYFGKNPRYLERIKQRIININDKNYNPDFYFDKEVLSYLKKKIKEKGQSCLNLVDKYEKYNINLKEYTWQQYHLHESTLISDFFKNIDSKEKAYWYGFLCADGFISKLSKGRRKKYDIGIELSKKDKNQLVKFCRYLGLNPSQKLKERTRIDKIRDNFVSHKRVRVVFTCKPMHTDLRNLGFASSKTARKLAPEFNKEELMLAWLLGYYDGDGTQGRTDICSVSKDFLEDIKRKFNIKNNILQYETTKKDLHDLGSDLISKRYIYRLFIGPKLFNKMMENYSDSMFRKRVSFKNDGLEILKGKIKSKEKLQEIVYKYRRTELIELFDTSRFFFDKLIKEWEVKFPPPTYWMNKPKNLSRKD